MPALNAIIYLSVLFVLVESFEAIHLILATDMLQNALNKIQVIKISIKKWSNKWNKKGKAVSV